MFKRKQKKTVQGYDRKTLIPVIRSSICTGEQVAGFKNRETGVFNDVMLVKSPRDIIEFINRYGVEPEEIIKDY